MRPQCDLVASEVYLDLNINGFIRVTNDTPLTLGNIVFAGWNNFLSDCFTTITRYEVPKKYLNKNVLRITDKNIDSLFHRDVGDTGLKIPYVDPNHSKAVKMIDGGIIIDRVDLWKPEYERNKLLNGLDDFLDDSSYDDDEG